MPGLENLLTRLIEARLRFVVVGGYAAVAHGATVVTQDVDICMPLDARNVASLLDALGDLHPVHRMTPARRPFAEADLGSHWKNLYLDTDWGQLDCLGEVAGIGDFEAVLDQSEEILLRAVPFRLLRIEALIRAKEAMRRPKDRETVLQLRAIRERRAGAE